MTDARDIVERDHIKETTETLFRIAINATMPKENEAKWCQALQYAGAMLEKQQADLASLRKQLEDARSEGWSGLRTYGKHRTDCRLYANSTLDCTCGLTDAIRALKGKS